MTRCLTLLGLLLAAAGAAQQPDLGKLAEPVRAAAGVAAMTTMDAAEDGSRRWVAWQEGQGDGQSARLALFRVEPGKAVPVWAKSWPDAYAPRLNVDTRWRYRGRPVVAVTVQFGAGAVEVALFGFQANDSPRQLADFEATAADWRRDGDGVAVLVLLDRGKRGPLIPRCLRWQETKAALVAGSCPR